MVLGLKPAFAPTGQMVDAAFGTDLIRPHGVRAPARSVSLTRLQRGILATARALAKERGTVFIAKLLEYAIAGRREAKNQVLSAIFEMREKRVLVPRSMD